GGFCADIWLSSYKVFPNGARFEPKAGAGVVFRLPLANNDHPGPGDFHSENIFSRAEQYLLAMVVAVFTARALQHQ
ncbi:MAG: hypothetical protein EB004_05450, partial [Actinobacteria bacterium]|nr:hypothetical protein [Actinomycetota bacterium]